MSTLLRVALRNVFRNKGRSTFSIVAILFGLTVLVFLQGFTNGFLKSVVEDAVLAKVGAVQVHRHGYLDAEKDPLKLDLPDDAATSARLRAVPGVVDVTRRITFEGMLSNGNVSQMFLATAIDPVSEYRVCPKRRDNVGPGSAPLDEKSTADALVGKQLVESLEARPGTTLSMLSATRRGAQNALDVTVRGTLPSRFIAESKRMATVTLAFAQDLLRMDGRVTEYVLKVEDLERADEVAARLRAALGPDYDVDTWRELAPQARDAVVRLRYVLLGISVILFLLVVTGIVNTMLMNVSERVREIGTMLAVGVRRWQVLTLFLFEAIALGFAGAVPGAAIGWGLVRLMGRGIQVSPPGGDPLMIYPFIRFGFIASMIGFAVAGTVLAALYPAWKASRMRPVEALRAN